MPIVIVKGTDGTKKKPLLKCSSSEQLLLDAAAAENGQISPTPKKGQHSTSNHPSDGNYGSKYDNKQHIVGDMSEILDFKLYRVTKPNFYEPVSRTILVGGEFFYNKEELNKVLRSTGEEEEKEKMPEIVNNKPTILQKIRQMKYTTKKLNTVNRNQKDILAHIKEATDRTKLIKSGKSLTASLELPTAEMTVDWAAHFVNVNEVDLANTFVQLDNKLKEFETSQRHHSPGAKIVFDAVSDENAVAVGHTKDAAGTRVSPLKREGTSNKTHGNLFTNGVTKQLSLAIQLENIKNSGTDAFVNHITAVPQVVPTPPSASRRSVDISHMPQHMHRRSSKQGQAAFNLHALKDSLPNAGIGELSGMQSHTLATIAEPGSKPHSQLPHQTSIPRKITHTNSSGSSGHPHRLIRGHSNISASGSVVEGVTADEHSSRPTSSQEIAHLAPSSPTGPPPQSPFSRVQTRTRTQSNIETLMDDGEDDVAVDSPRAASPVVPKSPNKSKPPKRKPSAPMRVATPGRIYSNAQVETQVAPQTGGVQMNSSTKDTIQELKHTQKLFEQSMGYATSVFESTTNKNQKLQDVIQAKLKKGNRGGQRIVNQWLSFRNINTKQRQNANEICQTKEFFRAADMLENISCLQMDGYDKHNDNNKLGVNAAKDIQYMRKNAALNRENKIMTRLVATKWFCGIVAKTRDYMRRMNNNIPICCLKFLTIFQYLLSYEYTITTELFYRILENSVVIKEDHIRSIVHVVIRAARDALGITPQEFLIYLESRNIQPCPELLNQIRAMNIAHTVSNDSRSQSSPQSRHSVKDNSNLHGGMLLDDCEEGLEFVFDNVTPRDLLELGGDSSVISSGDMIHEDMLYIDGQESVVSITAGGGDSGEHGVNILIEDSTAL